MRAGLLRPEERLLAYPWSSFGYYLAVPAHRPGWLRVDRLLGEHGLQEDGAAAWQEFERRVEAQRLEPGDEENLKVKVQVSACSPPRGTRRVVTRPSAPLEYEGGMRSVEA